MTAPSVPEFSKIKEAVSGWSGVRQFLRGGDAGQIVPVVILKERRRYGWLFLLGFSLYLVGFAAFVGGPLALLAGLVAFVFLVLALLWLWRGAIVEIEQGRPVYSRGSARSRVRSRRVGIICGGRG